MTIAHGGVLQNIHSALEPKKSKIGKKDSGSQECRMQLRGEPVENEGDLMRFVADKQQDAAYREGWCWRRY